MVTSAARRMEKLSAFGFDSRYHPMETDPLLEQKLAILRALDTRRKWHSLDDERVCVLCDRTITGRQIELIQDGPGRFTAHCPTEGCASSPGDWFYHGNANASPKPPAHRTSEVSFFWE